MTIRRLLYPIVWLLVGQVLTVAAGEQGPDVDP